ncbi:MAG: excinuclease ABC subunit UvrC [Nitrospirae bacterium]|nr:excinuclease ABC subunit UvrC [Nitrospirota bacterium]
MKVNKKIKKILGDLPHSPGVYRMLNDKKEIIYIGKAKDLSKRVRQYFQKQNHTLKTQKLLEKVVDIKFTAVDSDLEAILLETTLIKKHKPKYNVLMKDGKNYVYIKITDEDFPRILIVRKVEKDGAKYFGPKSAANKVKETFKVLKKILPFRHCSLDIKSLGDKKVEVTRKTIKYPCLDYYIKKCAAPCIGKCTKNEYRQIIKNVENFLKGKANDILASLNEEMQMWAQTKEFEKAGKVRDKIQKIKNILERQKVSDPNQTDKDIINYCVIHEKAYFNLFQIRDGKLINQENFILSAKHADSEENQEILESFANQYYQLATDIPKEILIPHKIENATALSKIIKSKFVIPKIGTKNKLLEMSLKNAQIYADRNKPSWETESKLTEKAVKDLQKILKFKTPLKRIECYDISHLSGTDTVGSMVVFIKGVPDKSMYRKFRLRTVEGKPDDYKSLEEVLTRRLLKITKEIEFKDFVFKKARKKDKEFIEKHNKVDVEKSDKQFFILEKNKKVKGFIAIHEQSKKVSEITNLFVLKSERGKKLGYKLVKSAIEKAKSKRVYGLCKKELLEYYQLFGFEEVKKTPDELLNKKNHICIVYDKLKHKPDKSFTQIPDLIVIDGGRGQLSAGTKVLKKLNLKIPYISLAKKLEEIFTPERKTPIILEKNNDALKLLQRARDEAHRFAISYNQNLRTKRLKTL